MAIVIPSSKTYDRQNPKVMDNVIERIEVVSNKIFINYENKIALSMPAIDAFSINESHEGYDRIDTDATESGGIKIKNDKFSAGGANWYNQFVDFEFEIPIGTTDVHYFYKNLVIVLTRTYSKSTTTQKSFTDTFTHTNNSRKEFNFRVVVGEPTYNDLGLTPSDLILYLDQSLTSSTQYPFYMNLPNKIKGKIAYSVGVDSQQNEDFERVLNTQITFMVKKQVILEEKTINIGNQNQKKVYSVDGNKLMQTSNYIKEDVKVRITGLGGSITAGYFTNFEVLEGTIKVGTWVYFEKGHSAQVKQDGNGYYFHTMFFVGDISEEIYGFCEYNALETMFSQTQQSYKNGKETATIRCSISDYYDYDTNEKVIAIDNSTEKMSFSEYDQVIPMVYGADRQDYPMSTYQDGSPKVFQVLGVKKFYNGAVWQELYLQEA